MAIRCAKEWLWGRVVHRLRHRPPKAPSWAAFAVACQDVVKDENLHSDFVNHEHLFEYFSGLLLSFFGEPDGLGFPDRIGDQTLFMEPIHRIPIKAFSDNATMIKVKIKQSQNRVINTFLIEFQRWLLFPFHFRTPI
jgi:hypothetical protein